MSRTAVVAVVAVVAYAAVAALLAPYSWPQRVATGIPCVIAVAVAVRRGWHRTGRGAPSPTGTARRAPLVVWVVLLAVLFAVQMLNFYSEPRAVYPTFSAVASDIFHLYPVRAAAFAAWLGAGWYLIDR